jgi:cytoplasmic tRNA 2-thiolation protein 2
MPLLSGKIRRCLEPFINDKKNSTRRTYLKASGDLLIGFSGGLGSTVLLDLIHRIYFPSKIESERRAELLKGGTAHPRNEMVWQKTRVCYIEVCSAFPNVSLHPFPTFPVPIDQTSPVSQMKDRTEDVRAVLEKYEPFEFFPLRLEDAFSDEWWKKVGGKPSQALAIDITNEGVSQSVQTQKKC